MEGTHLVFGPYTFAAHSGDLRKNGVRLRMQRKPQLVLSALLEAHGEIVTRQELQRRLWPQDTFVDFEQGLNVAIKRLRDALCDSAVEPRYVETIPGMGYRFIAEVQTISNGNGRVMLATLPEAQLNAGSVIAVATGSAAETAGFVPATAVVPERVAPRQEASEPRLFVRRLMAVLAVSIAVVALAAVSYVGWKKFRPQRDARLQTHRIVVLPFKNLTGDAAQKYYCDGLTDELIAQLGTLYPQKLQVIARTSAMHYEGSSLTAAEIGAELKSDYVLDGSVRRLGTRYRIAVQLTDAQSQANLWMGVFDREFKDVLDVHRDVALAVAGEIGQRVSPHSNIRRLGRNPSARLPTTPTFAVASTGTSARSLICVTLLLISRRPWRSMPTTRKRMPASLTLTRCWLPSAPSLFAKATRRRALRRNRHSTWIRILPRQGRR